MVCNEMSAYDLYLKKGAGAYISEDIFQMDILRDIFGDLLIMICSSPRASDSGILGIIVRVNMLCFWMGC